MQSMPCAQWLKMYDLLTDVLVWVKDSDSRIQYANRAFIEHTGLGSLEQALGKTDYDFAPRHIARQFLADDHKVLGGEVINDRLEMNVLRSGELHWFTTNKRPLYDHLGRRIGTCGISRHLHKTSIMLGPLASIEKPMEFIRRNFTQPVQVSELANLCHLSVSALERRFRKALGKTPKQLINQLRLDHARRLLVETDLPVYLVAEQSGFSDANYFSRQFLAEFGESPSCFRQAFR
ncbi:AraC family transcriptional regulator [Bowmanella denitrificans]|uniref:AraC family transcriptional regulator n=1 Tax=Bowmanella denitrificans TaxID=366582 RepID=UPI001FE7CC26|nr:AraC family transcriptional regulator [Bowmanella denitrificans]